MPVFNPTSACKNALDSGHATNWNGVALLPCREWHPDLAWTKAGK